MRYPVALNLWDDVQTFGLMVYDGEAYRIRFSFLAKPSESLFLA